MSVSQRESVILQNAEVLAGDLSRTRELSTLSGKNTDFLLCCLVCLGLHLCGVVECLGRHRARQV